MEGVQRAQQTIGHPWHPKRIPDPLRLVPKQEQALQQPVPRWLQLGLALALGRALRLGLERRP